MFFYRFLARLFSYRWDRLASLEQQTLLRLVSVAAANDISTAQITRAFAEDSSAMSRLSVRRLAQRLDEGVSLAKAIEPFPQLISERGLLAVQCGSEMGTLAESLAQATRELDTGAESAVQKVTDTCVYVGCLLLFVTLIGGFQLIKLLPTFQTIFADFETRGTPLFDQVVNVSLAIGPFSFFFIAAGLLAGWYVVTGKLSRSLRHGWIGRLIHSESANGTLSVLDQLAVCKEAGRPEGGALSTLAEHHFARDMRRKLVRAHNEVEQGTAVWDALASARILSTQESRVLHISEQVGNTGWVLRQLAEKRRATQAWRLQVFSQLLLPVLVIGIACLVGFVGIGFLGSVFQLCLEIR